MKTLCFSAALLVMLVGVTTAADVPSMPYTHAGACPFECCQYGDWTARSSATAFKTKDRKSSVAFQIKPGDKVKAVTGVVITRKPGTVRMLKDFSIDDATVVPAGTLLYTLHNGGEGSTFVWFAGKALWTNLYAESARKGNASFPWDVLSLPQAEWWAEVQNQRGVTGWILQPQNFTGMDGCGG